LSRHTAWLRLTLLTFLVNGLSSALAKAQYVLSLGQFKTVFIFASYAGATTVALFATLRCFQKPSQGEFLVGTIMAVTGIGAYSLLVLSLETLDAIVVYPLASSLGVATTAATSRILWGERVGPKGIAGMAMALLALLLLAG